MKNKLLLLVFLMFFFIIGNVYAEGETIIDEVTVNIPSAPVPGANVDLEYSIPFDANYTKATWGGEKIFLNGYIDENKYVEGEDYEWFVVVCPKEGYAFPSTPSDLNIIANGFDVNDENIVKNKSVSINTDACRGLDLVFQTLPGTAYKFLSTPKYSTNAIYNEVVNLSFKFSADAEIKLEWNNGNEWVEIERLNVFGNEKTTFSVPTETEAIDKYYRLNYNDKRFAEFRINWVDPNKIIYDVEVTLPKRPLVGREIDHNYSIPNNVNYTKVTWNDEKMFITSSGFEVNGIYEDGKSYIWSAIVCPKKGYSFPENIFDLNFNVKGVDLNDDEYIYSHYLTENANTCRGIQISFKPLVYYPLTIPNLQITSNNNKVTLNWDKQLYAIKYVLYRSTDNKNWSKYQTLTTNTFVDKSLTYGKTYYYKVRVYDEVFDKTSAAVSIKIKPNKPILNIKSAGSNNVKLNWDKVSVTGYVIYQSTDNVTWTNIKSITSNSTLEYNVKKLKANKTYYFKMRAYKTVDGKKIYSSYSAVVSTKTAPVAPSIKLKIKDYNAINVVVGESKGSIYYLIDRSIDGKKYERVGALTSAGTFASTNLTTGKVYYYRVKACNNQNRCSSWISDSLKSTPKTPSITVKSNKTKTVTITLGEVKNVKAYKIYRATSKNGKYKLVKKFYQGEQLIFNDKTLKGVTYYYKTRTYVTINGVQTHSPYSSIKKIVSK